MSVSVEKGKFWVDFETETASGVMQAYTTLPFVPFVGLVIEVLKTEDCTPYDVLYVDAVTWNETDERFICKVTIGGKPGTPLALRPDQLEEARMRDAEWFMENDPDPSSET